MLKRYYDSRDERKLKEQSWFMFEEISSGVYAVIKDRFDLYGMKNFDKIVVGSGDVVSALNNAKKVAVTGKSGMYANFELIIK